MDCRFNDVLRMMEHLESALNKFEGARRSASCFQFIWERKNARVGLALYAAAAVIQKIGLQIETCSASVSK